MSQRVYRETLRFTAFSDDGDEFTIVRYTVFHGTKGIEGTSRFQTDDGEAVNWVSKGQYHHVNLELDLFSDDPSAP